MANDDRDRRDAAPIAAALGQSVSSATNAGTEFFARVLEIGSRQIADAIVQAMRPSQGEGSGAGRFDALLARYRDALGEIAFQVPKFAQRLSQASKSPDGQRWLFRAYLGGRRPRPIPGSNPGVPKMPNLSRLGDVTPVESGLLALAMTQSVEHGIAQAIGMVPGEIPEAIRKTLSSAVSDGRVRSIPKLLDQLKYALRRNGMPALDDIRKQLAWMNDPEVETAFKFVEQFTRAAGENCARELLKVDILGRLDRKPPSLPDALRDALHSAFQFGGIELSGRLSVLAQRQRWLILDHATDRVFEARGHREHESQFVDVFGPTHCSYWARLGRREFLLPVRVMDASHGFAVWSVEKQTVQEHLNLRPHNTLKAWDIGASKTPLILFMTEQRDGDLGPYLELGLACVVTPRKDPLAVGMIVVRDILVTAGLGQVASNTIWGARKVAANLHFVRSDRAATMVLANEEGRVLMRLTLPRGGDGSSADIPLFLYTYKGDVLHRTIVTRSGSGESMRAGGSGVSLEITGAGDSHVLCDDMRHFGVAGNGTTMPNLTPMFTAWSERVSAELPYPEPISEQDDDD